MCTIIVINI